MKRGLKIAAITALYLVLASGTFAQTAQNPDPSKWMCRNLADSGGYVYQGETIFGSQACRPIPQASTQAQAATSPTTVASTQVQQREAQAIPVVSSAASGRVPTGKPQVTMFRHQTLGESWEDFLRITSIDVSTCMVQQKPLPEQWCETFKKIEAGQNATLSDSNPSASVSLVFSEKKLVQVLVLAKADWAKSFAEFTQTYSAPDTQTPNSAGWSFADGGGIAASTQSGNLVRANFYSKDAKPRDQEASATQPEPLQLNGQAHALAESGSASAVGSPSTPVQFNYLNIAELQAAAQGSGKGVTITAGSAMGQAFAASLANVNLAQYASVQLFTTESWIAFRAQVARRQYQQFNPANLSQAETLRGLIVVALGGAYGSNAGPQCNSVTRIALVSDKGGAVVAEAISQESASSSWNNAFGASASCDALVAKFAATDVQRVSSAAQKGEYFIGVFSGSNLLFMYKVKEKYLKELGR
jgi:hypothetical protein